MKGSGAGMATGRQALKHRSPEEGGEGGGRRAQARADPRVLRVAPGGWRVCRFFPVPFTAPVSVDQSRSRITIRVFTPVERPAALMLNAPAGFSCNSA